MFLFNGQIISTKKDKSESEIIKFEQLNIDLSDLVTTTIKKPKLQETSTLTLLSCFVSKQPDVSLCKEDAKKEIVPILIRRVVMPFYIPVITLLCSFLLFRNKNLYFNKASVFCYAFSLLLFTELIIRYTGLNDLLGWIYLILTFSLIAIFYFFLNSKFSSEAKLQ